MHAIASGSLRARCATACWRSPPARIAAAVPTRAGAARRCPIALLVDLSTRARRCIARERRPALHARLGHQGDDRLRRLRADRRRASSRRDQLMHGQRRETVGQLAGRGLDDVPRGGRAGHASTSCCTAITTVSANDGCGRAGRGARGQRRKWVALMNADARAARHARQPFRHAQRLAGRRRAPTSPRATWRVLAEAMITRHPELYRRYFGQQRHARSTGSRSPTTIRSPAWSRVPTGSRPGFTNEAGYNFLGSAERDGRRLVMVIARRADRARSRNRRRATCSNGASARSRAAPLFAGGASVGEARVQDGAARQRRAATAARGARDACPRADRRGVTLAIRYRRAAARRRSPRASRSPSCVIAVAGQAARAMSRWSPPRRWPRPTPLAAAASTASLGLFWHERAGSSSRFEGGEGARQVDPGAAARRGADARGHRRAC